MAQQKGDAVCPEGPSVNRESLYKVCMQMSIHNPSVVEDHLCLRMSTYTTQEFMDTITSKTSSYLSYLLCCSSLD